MFLQDPTQGPDPAEIIAQRLPSIGTCCVAFQSDPLDAFIQLVEITLHPGRGHYRHQPALLGPVIGQSRRHPLRSAA